MSNNIVIEKLAFTCPCGKINIISNEIFDSLQKQEPVDIFNNTDSMQSKCLCGCNLVINQTNDNYLDKDSNRQIVETTYVFAGFSEFNIMEIERNPKPIKLNTVWFKCQCSCPYKMPVNSVPGNFFVNHKCGKCGLDIKIITFPGEDLDMPENLIVLGFNLIENCLIKPFKKKNMLNNQAERSIKCSSTAIR